MSQDYIHKINRISSDEDASLKAISLLMNGFPIRINNKEIILLDKIYERKEVNGSPDVVPSLIDLSDIPNIVFNISNEEHNYIIESHRYNVENNKDSLFVTSIVSSLIDDFNQTLGKSLEINEYYDIFSLEKTVLDNPLIVKINQNSRPMFSSNTLKVPGKRIDRIDSIWELSIPGQKNKFIWGYGINLSREVLPAKCRIVDIENTSIISDDNTLSY